MTRRLSPASKRRVGRPRADGREPTVGPVEDILHAAARLFAERGFVGTSTAQIAAAAGLRQSAVFYWFATKDAILETLFARGWDRSLAYFERVGGMSLPSAVKLCLCLGYDAYFVADAEPALQVMIVPPELRQPRFKHLLRKRQRLISYLEDFIGQAIVEGDFRAIEPAAAARMVLAIDEVVLDAAPPRRKISPRRHAETAVDFALHALAVDRARMRRIRRQVERYLREQDVGNSGA